jgi:Tol biopolymer transport system component
MPRRQQAPAFAATPAPTAATGATGAAAPEPAAEIAPATARLDTAKTRCLNVRAGPGAGYARLATLAADDVVAVVGRSAGGSWLQLALDAGASGWASAYYLVVDGDIDSLPVTEPTTTADATTDVDEVDTATSAAVPISQSPNPPISNTNASGLSGTIVFQSGQGGAIYAYDLDSGDLRQLATGFDPAISPDGQTVAFTRQGSDGGLYLIDSDGGSERRIYTGPLNMASPKWSEDGASIVFSYAVSSMECRDMGSGRCVADDEFLNGRYSDLDANDYPLITKYEYDLGVVAADGGNFHSLSALPSSRAPDWGAAGIVYQSSDGLQTIQDAPGASSQVVTYDMLQPAYQDPDWQPGGGRIVFQKQGASHWQIWAVDPNGGNMVALTQPQTVLVDALPSSVAPAWSPDGAQIAFMSNREDDGEAGAWRLWVMDADGSNQRPLPIEVELKYTFGAEQMVSWGG